MFWMKNFEIHTIDRCYQEEHLKLFTEFFVHILHQQLGLKWKNAILTLLEFYSTRFLEFQATDSDV